MFLIIFTFKMLGKNRVNTHLNQFTLSGGYAVALNTGLTLLSSNTTTELNLVIMGFLYLGLKAKQLGQIERAII